MLKTFRGLILGLVVLVGSAYVTPTYASSASIKIVEVQPGSVDSPLDEMVVLYNQSNKTVELTNWCLTNKADIAFACLGQHGPDAQLLLPAYSYVLIISDSLTGRLPDGSYSVSYAPTHGGWGSLVTGGDTVSLYGVDGSLVDHHAWTSGIAPDQIWRRASFGIPPVFVYNDVDAITDWRIVTPTGIETDNATLVGEPYPNGPDPLDPDPIPDPQPGIITGDLRLSEILPNPQGSDVGAEYIELYNSGTDEVNLKSYTLRVGRQLEKSYQLPDELLPAGRYRVFTHADFSFTLLNTDSRVALYVEEQEVESVEYSGPGDDMAWVNIDGVWQYTNMATPGAENMLARQPEQPVDVDEEPVVSSLKPCAPNQYRNPETNRCRLISASTPSLVPCKEGQERNPETNRCRNIATATKTPTPCKEGQERNPETNRCRNIVSMTNAPHGVLGVQEVAQEQRSWYLWVVVAMVVAAALVYAAWEWRVEVRRFILRLKERLVRTRK